MANITAQLVKELRDTTQAGMMDCKKALIETDGDMEKAIELLREKGLAAAAKKASRIAAEGMVDGYVTEDQKTGVIVEVNCETDFVAKTDNFINFCHNIARHIALAAPADVETLMTQKFVDDPAKTITDLGVRRDRSHRRENLRAPLCPLRGQGRRGGDLYPHGRKDRRTGRGQ